MKSASTAVPRPVFSTLHLFTETDNCQSVAQSAIKSRTVCSFDISRPFFIIKSVNSNRLTPFGLLYNVFLQLTRFRPTQRVCSSRASLIPVTHVISQQCPDAASVRFDPSVRKPIYDVFFHTKKSVNKKNKNNNNNKSLQSTVWWREAASYSLLSPSEQVIVPRGRRDDMSPPPDGSSTIAADLRPSADGSAVRKSLASCRQPACLYPRQLRHASRVPIA